MIVVPSTMNKKSCTGLFDLKTNQWNKLKRDLRKAPINGTMDRFIMKNGQEKILYMGGKSVENETDNDGIWEFQGKEWKELDIKLPKSVVENATKFIAAPYDFC